MSEACMKWQEKHLQLWEEALKAKFLGEGKPWTGEDLEKILQNYTVSPCLLGSPPRRYSEKLTTNGLLIGDRGYTLHSLRRRAFGDVSECQSYLDEP